MIGLIEQYFLFVAQQAGPVHPMPLGHVPMAPVHAHAKGSAIGSFKYQFLPAGRKSSITDIVMVSSVG